MSRQPDYPLDADTAVFNGGNPAPFQHNGVEYQLPTGVSVWSYEIAERLARKLGKFGVSIAGFPGSNAVRLAKNPEPVVEVAEPTPQDPPAEDPAPEAVEVAPAEPEPAPQAEANSGEAEEAVSE